VLADEGSNKIHKARWLTPDPLDGNLTQDPVHTYTWDADGNLVGVDSTTAAYDAFDRLVEVSNGSHEQVVYGPGGGKLALMNGQTLQQAFVPLAGGAEAVYTPSGLAYYRHSDWLGSSRLASTPSRSVYYDGAYAPYGESYAESGTPDHSFTGQHQDVAPSGAYPLYDFLAREYNPTWGRWLSPDPMGGDVLDPQSLNRYAYVDNNPASLTDPLGLQSDSDCEEWDNGSCTGDPTCDNFLNNPWGCQPPPCVVLSIPCVGYGGGGGGGSTGGGDGGGTVSSAPPAGQPPLTGGEDFVGLPPCLPNYKVLIPALVGALNAALHPTSPIAAGDVAYLDTQGGAPEFVVNQGGATSLWQPLHGSSAKGDLFHHANGKTLADQAVFPQPKDVVPGAGSVLHILYNPDISTTGGAVKIQDLRAHFDILSPRNPLHFGTDVVFARIVSAIEGCGQGGIKFQ
jgi:RHS repeat-associated protein